MTRVKIEYGKAVVLALCAAALVALSVIGHTLEAAGGVLALGALTFCFVVRARAFARLAARRGCGQAPRP